MAFLLAIGTAKGLFLAHSDDDRRTWRVERPQFPVDAVYAAAIDTRRGAARVLAAAHSGHFGPAVLTSDDLGKSWDEPDHAPVAFPADTGASLARVWQIAPGTADEPDVVYAGTEPSALFRSTDGGRTYELVRGLWDHPHRPTWHPGGGGQAVHTVLPHPDDTSRVLVAMSTGGVYGTTDGGVSWAPSNAGIKVSFLPDPYPEYGQCVHKVARDATDPDRLYLQNHGGVFRSDNGASSWESIADGLPSDFGFPMVAHPHRGGVAYNFPLYADVRRYPVDEQCRVFRTSDAGKTWEPLTAGLPTEPFYPSVLRDAMWTDGADPAGIYFGTRTGEVYASRDEGDSWNLVAAHLPDVLCVRAAEV
jgi:photosystem II stability/assembly factor-like uncharacterized protein